MTQDGGALGHSGHTGPDFQLGGAAFHSVSCTDGETRPK